MGGGLGNRSPRQRVSASRRRRPAKSHAVSAEILERREVLSGASLTLAQAQQDVQTAETALNNSILTYINAIVGLENQLTGDLAQHQNTFDILSGQAIYNFENAVDGIIANMDAVLDPIEDQYEDDVDQIEEDLQDDYDDAQQTFTNDSQAEYNSLTNDLAGIAGNLDNDVQQADSTLTGTDTTQTGILNGTITTEEGDFDADVLYENNIFNGTVQSEETGFENDETANFTNYETLLGDDTSGFIGNYKTLVTGFETIRDNQLANYPNTVYDPSVLDPIVVQAVIDGAYTTFENNIAPFVDAYDTNTVLIEGNYQSDVQDAWDDFADDMLTAANTRTQRYADADQDYEDTLAVPRANYAFNMADILSTFTDDMADADNDRTDAYTLALDIYNTTMTPVIAQYEDDVDNAVLAYEDWENGVGPNNVVTNSTWIRTKTVDSSTSPATVTWTVNGVLTTIATNTTWGGMTSSKEPTVPAGYTLQGQPSITTSGSVITTTETYVKSNPTAPTGVRANPYEMALYARFESYANELDGINDVYDDTIDDANSARTTAIDAANAQYISDVYGNSTGMAPYGANSPADVFFGTMNGAQTIFSNTESSEWQDYMDDVNAYYTSLFQQITANPISMIAPNPAILDGYAQTYLVNSLNAAIDYLQTVGAAWVAFVGQERAFDSTRDQGLIQAEYDYAVKQENAANTADQAAIGSWSAFVQDALGINADYTVARAGKQKDRDQAIVDAGQTLLLAHNGAAETKAHSEALADKNHADRSAVVWDNRLQAEAVEEHTLSIAENGAEETRINDRAVADAGHATDGALAAHTRDTRLTQAEVDRATGLTNEQHTLTTGALQFVPQLFSDIANGVDALYTSHFNNDPDQAAVSNLWTQFTTQAGNAWSILAGQEASLWRNYQNQTTLDWQSMANTITDAAQDVVDNLAPEYTTMVRHIATGLHGYWDAMTNALQLRNQTVSTNVLNRTQQANTEIQSSEDAIIGYARTAEDDATNDSHAATGNVLTTHKQFVTDMANNALPFQQTLIGSLGNILTNIRSLANTQTLADLDSTKNIIQQATTTDDGIFPNWANLQSKQEIESTVIQRDAAVNFTAIQLAYSFVSRVYPTFYATSSFQDDASYSAIQQLLVGQFLANPIVAQAVGQPVVQQPPQQTQQNQLQQVQNQPFVRTAVTPQASRLPGTGGFFDSIGSSVYSIGQGLYGTGQGIGAWFTGDWTGYNETMAAAYQNGPLGQSLNHPGWSYWGTRGSLLVATGSITAAGAVWAWGAMGFATYGVGITRSGHVLYTITANGTRQILHMPAMTRLGQVVTSRGGQYFWRQIPYFQRLEGIPILFPELAGSTVGVGNCAWTALHALGRGLFGF